MSAHGSSLTDPPGEPRLNRRQLPGRRIQFGGCYSMSRIIVFGATGFTGRLATEALLRHGVRPVLVGRDQARLRTLARELGGGLETVQVRVEDPATIAAALENGDV